MRKTWQSQFDSAWLPANADRGMVRSGRSENCIKSPRQIRILGVTRGRHLISTKTVEQVLESSTLSPNEEAELESLLEDYKLNKQKGNERQSLAGDPEFVKLRQDLADATEKIASLEQSNMRLEMDASNRRWEISILQKAVKKLEDKLAAGGSVRGSLLT